LNVSLSSEGYRVFEADNARTGLAILEARSDLGLILLDHMLDPVESGSWFLKQKDAIASRRHVPVVIMTALSRTTQFPDGIPVIRKPFELDALLNLVKEVLAKNRS